MAFCVEIINYLKIETNADFWRISICHQFVIDAFSVTEPCAVFGKGKTRYESQVNIFWINWCQYGRLGDLIRTWCEILPIEKFNKFVPF